MPVAWIADLRSRRSHRRAIGRYPLVVITLAVGVAALIMFATGNREAAGWGVSAYALAVCVFEAAGMIRTLMSGRLGLDFLAIVAIVSTVLVGEYWASLVIVLMLAGGAALEEYANGRARRELTALLARVPTTARKLGPDGAVIEIPVGQIEAGDELIVQPGAVLPVDGRLLTDLATFDESPLTGESLPVDHRMGETVLSGSVNGDRAIQIMSTATAATSQYQRIVDLVQEAAEDRPPMVRLADRYAVPFTLVALAIASVAWLFSGNPARFAEVLVVATPCPLLLAAPVAFVSGISRAAKAGIIVKGGSTLEQLYRVKTAAFDKTGTLTHGEPAVVGIRPHGGIAEDELLSLAVSVERYSGHVLARAVARAAAERGLRAEPSSDVVETTAAGLSARVGKRRVAVGKRSFITAQGAIVPAVSVEGGLMAIYLAVDGRYAGSIQFADRVRENAASTLAELSTLGVTRTLMLTGDLRTTAQHIADRAGITDVRAECLPEDKVKAIKAERLRPIMMVGDGVNDAPVLAAADIGVAMGARGSTAASESADVVIMLDDVSRIALAVRIGHETTRIAIQAIWLGISISLGLMVVASFGLLPALLGAILQEVVDVVTILYALRALIGTFDPTQIRPGMTGSGVTEPHHRTGVPDDVH